MLSDKPLSREEQKLVIHEYMRTIDKVQSVSLSEGILTMKFSSKEDMQNLIKDGLTIVLIDANDKELFSQLTADLKLETDGSTAEMRIRIPEDMLLTTTVEVRRVTYLAGMRVQNKKFTLNAA